MSKMGNLREIDSFFFQQRRLHKFNPEAESYFVFGPVLQNIVTILCKSHCLIFRHTREPVIDLETSQILSMPSKLIRMVVVTMKIVWVKFFAL